MFKDLKSLLSKSIQRAGIAGQVGSAQITKIFEEITKQILSEETSSKTKAVDIKDKTLLVACLSSAAVQELQLKEAEIIKKINKTIGKEIVRKIKYIT